MALSRALPGGWVLRLALAGLLVLVGLLAGYDPRLGIVAALGLVFAYVAFTDLTAALVLVIIVIFAEATPIAGPALSASKLAGLLLVLAWLARIATDPRERARSLFTTYPRLSYVLAALLSWVAISISWSVDTPSALKHTMEFLLPAILFVIVHNAVRTSRQAVYVVAAFVAGALIAAFYGLIAGDMATDTGRLESTVGDPNFLAAVLIAGIGLLIFGFLAAKRKALLRLLILAALAVCLTAFVLTGSRGGIFGLAVALVVAIAFGGQYKARIAVAVSCLAIVAGGYYAFYAPESLIARIDQATQGEIGTQDSRLTIWTVAWRMVGDHPVHGVGIGSFQAESIHYVLEPGTTYRTDLIIDQPKVVHNTFLGPLAELGVIGLALFVFVLAAAFGCAVQAARMFQRNGNFQLELIARGLVVALAGMLTAAFFLSAESNKFLWLMLAMGPALLTIAREERAGRLPATHVRQQSPPAVAQR